MKKKKQKLKITNLSFVDPITSPYSPTISSKRISDEELEQVKKILGMNSVLIVADSDPRPCDPETCMGHKYEFRRSGMSHEQIIGMAHSIIESYENGWTIE